MKIRLFFFFFFSSLPFVNCPVHFICICKEGSGREEGAADGAVTWGARVTVDGHLCRVPLTKQVGALYYE